MRTITNGIPGSPMPSFGAQITEEQKKALAEYVLSLGPEQVHVDPKDSEMVVRDRPLVVRGKLPPIVDGAPEWPRGLFIGLPDGLTFAYRADDVRLLGVRLGGFVNRTDWGGRGGTALQPLGAVVWSADSDTAACVFSSSMLSMTSHAKPLAARLRHTWAQSDSAGVAYDLCTPAGAVQARVWERPKGLATSLGTGFVRDLTLEFVDGADPIAVGIELRNDRAATLEEHLGLVAQRGTVVIVPLAAGAYRIGYLRGEPPHGGSGTSNPDARTLRHFWEWDPKERKRQSVEWILLPYVRWEGDRLTLLDALEKELGL